MPSTTQTRAALTTYAVVIFDGERGTVQDIGPLAEMEADVREHHTAPSGQVMAQVLSMRHFDGVGIGDRVYDPHC